MASQSDLTRHSSQGPAKCPGCGRDLDGARNFCPYCGHSFRQRASQTAAPSGQVGGAESQMQSPPSAKPYTPQPAGTRADRRFRFADLRVFVGLFGVIDLAVILVLLFVLFRPSTGPRQASVCEQLDSSEFTPEKYERGLGGTLEEDTLLSASTEYLIQTTLEVPKGRRLLVEPGATLEFDAGAALEVRGALYVCGTGGQPVTLTAHEKKAGSWPGIRFYSADDESTISHALIQFTEDRGIYLEDSAPQLIDVEIAHSSGFPISVDGNRVPQVLAEVSVDDNPFRGIEIRSGTLTEETIRWPNHGLVYVVSGPLQVDENTTLDIDPDVIVKFWHAPGAQPPGIGVRGLLRAAQVQFTSVYDSRDTVGGATYHEAQDPEPGDWAGIGFSESSAKSHLRQCTIRYAGHSQQGAVAMKASSPELTDVAIYDTAWYPLSADAESFPVLARIEASDNDPGDALEIRAGSALAGRHERIWSPLGEEQQIVRVVRGDLTIEPEATLVIEPGVVIKFEEKARIIVKGTLLAVGGTRETERIVFTSLRDDDYGGETDKATGPRDSRSWGGIVFEQVDQSSALENAIVRYASVVLNDASPRLTSNLILDCDSAAIRATPSSAPELLGTAFRDNAIDGLLISQARIEEDTRWPVLGAADAQVVRVLEGEVTIAPGANLSIDPGAVIKVTGANGKLRVQGALWVFGEEGTPVSFTSLHDDSLGGDTNQRLQGPDAGDWVGIEVDAGGQTYFAHTAIRYAQTGLSLRGDAVPDIEGWLRILDGKDALHCFGEIHLSRLLFAEGNGSNEIQCPTE